MLNCWLRLLDLQHSCLTPSVWSTKIAGVNCSEQSIGQGICLNPAPLQHTHQGWQHSTPQQAWATEVPEATRSLPWSQLHPWNFKNLSTEIVVVIRCWLNLVYGGLCWLINVISYILVHQCSCWICDLTPSNSSDITPPTGKKCGLNTCPWCHVTPKTFQFRPLLETTQQERRLLEVVLWAANHSRDSPRLTILCEHSLTIGHQPRNLGCPNPAYQKFCFNQSIVSSGWLLHLPESSHEKNPAAQRCCWLQWFDGLKFLKADETYDDISFKAPNHGNQGPISRKQNQRNDGASHPGLLLQFVSCLWLSRIHFLLVRIVWVWGHNQASKYIYI